MCDVGGRVIWEDLESGGESDDADTEADVVTVLGLVGGTDEGLAVPAGGFPEVDGVDEFSLEFVSLHGSLTDGGWRHGGGGGEIGVAEADGESGEGELGAAAELLILGVLEIDEYGREGESGADVGLVLSEVLVNLTDFGHRRDDVVLQVGKDFSKD